jgi:hypothetical protein
MAPADWPISVIRFGSPPKDAAFVWIHFRAKRWSRRATLLFGAMGKPRIPRR